MDEHVTTPDGRSITVSPSSIPSDPCWYYGDSNCCFKCEHNGPVTVQQLHQLWLNNEIQDSTKVSSYVTSSPVKINKIWEKDASSNTVTMREDTFSIGDEIKYKSWLSSPESYDSWVYITKRQKGNVTAVGQTYITCNFEADTGYKCAIHEIENISTKKANYSGCARFLYMTKTPLRFITGLHSKFKNHILGLLLKLFTECYDVITDVLFTILLYNKGEMDLFIVSVITLFLPSILSYFISFSVIYSGTDIFSEDTNNEDQHDLWCMYCSSMVICSCCCCGMIFPCLIIFSTLIKLWYCIVNGTWYFTNKKNEAYGQYPLVMFQVVMTFFIRITEDLPQIVINFIFVYDRNDGEMELINLMSIAGSIVMIIKTILFDWREYEIMRSFAAGLRHSDHTTRTGHGIVNATQKKEKAAKRRAALGL